MEQKGEGIGNAYQGVKNKVSSYLTVRPLAMQKLLNEYGKDVIQKINVCRQPITGAIRKAGDIATFGDISSVVEEKGYDAVYHLYCIIYLDSGKIVRLDKNHRVTIEVNPGPLRADAECKSTTLPHKETLETFIEKGEVLGDEVGSFYRYSAWDNNCQKFIKVLLNASGNTSLDSFIMQEAGEFLKPGVLRKVTGYITDAAALADYAYHGGKRQKRKVRKKQTGSGKGCGVGCGDCGFCNG